MSEQEPILLTTPVARVPGIGESRGRKLAELGLNNVGRLIAHLPHRHERIEAEAAISELELGANVTARGEVSATRVAGRGRRARFEAVLMDDTGRLDLVWFNQAYLRGRIVPGMVLRVRGKLNEHNHALQIANAQWEEIDPELDDEQIVDGLTLRPIYPASEAVTSRQIEYAIVKVLDDALALIDDHLDEAYRTEREMPELRQAYRMMHTPKDEGEVVDAKRRLAYDELLLLQLGVHLKRLHLRKKLCAPALACTPRIDEQIRGRFPFALTDAQERVVLEVAQDLSQTTPTNRLIQGDVGSGKTVVALYAMLLAVASGHQAALMAPTELLAEQHYATITDLLEGARVRIGLLTASLTSSEREALVEQIESGSVDLVIGTHALLSEAERFLSLGVVVIDEQHRFGVHQRAVLRTDRNGHTVPHTLVMTATPIPRTMALTLFGDLDVSTIDALPPGRTPIKTRVVGSADRERVYGWLGERVAGGEQAFIVVPAIDPSEIEMMDVRTLMGLLENGQLRGRRLAALHGRLKRETREQIMHRFRAGKIDVLVATTVIEVGVDVPNATVMVIENADRFGLAQLHQLRGRVGRGSRASACVLIGDAKTPDAEQRLAALAQTGDGFVLAQRDMEIRGPGEVFGVKQSGMPPFRVADLSRDTDLLSMASRDAREWIERTDGLQGEGDALVRRRLLKAHGRWLGLGDVG